MFLISVCFRRSRSKENRDKPGVVYYRISGHSSMSDGPKLERSINSDIRGVDEDTIKIEKEKIIPQLRLFYCVIERLEEQRKPFSIDDVADNFREALLGSSSMSEIIAKSKTEFPIRRDLVSVGREFRNAFSYVFTINSEGNTTNLYDYIFNQIQSLKNEQRICQARNFRSLQSSLYDFTNAESLKFSEVDSKFIQNYALWLKQKRINESTQSFYLRTFRSILNKAHKDGLVDASPNWFKEVNTQIYHSSDIARKKLNRELLLKIANLDLSKNDPLALVRDMFMFGFYCGGMELVDIANLIKSNINNNRLVYRRRLNGQKKTIILGKQANAIIKRYSDNARQYLFPLLEKSGCVMFSTVRNQVSQSLKTIGRFIGFPNLTFTMNASTYKSLASGVSISELLLTCDDVI